MATLPQFSRLRPMAAAMRDIRNNGLAVAKHSRGDVLRSHRRQPDAQFSYSVRSPKDASVDDALLRREMARHLAAKREAAALSQTVVAARMERPRRL
jgi:hypothetical protein